MTSAASVSSDGTKPRTCWRCGADFGCGPRDGAAHCWCSDLPAILPLTADLSCLCPRCLAVEVAAQKRTDPVAPPNGETVLAEGVDYYVEGAAVVFTAAYHLRRGTCCGNGCRHCPFDGQRPVTDRSELA